MSWERVENQWLNVRSSLWFIPSILAAVAILLSFIMPEIDKQVEGSVAENRHWLFYGTADAGRSILSTIAGSLITVIALLFSITILTVQQASTQYTPRVIRNFTGDRPSQLVLGTYLATFLYCVLIMRQVRSQADENDFTLERFVPVISISFAIVLTVICLGMLVYFIHHTATLFQASTVIESVHRDLLNGIRELYPTAIGQGHGMNDDTLERFRERHGYQELQEPTLIRAQDTGFLRTVDEDAIREALSGADWMILHPRVGSYINHRQILAEAGGVGHVEIDDKQLDAIRSAFVVDHQRTLEQDGLFGVRQLVDIALKGLSPAINDPTTAEHAISCLGDVLISLSDREFPERTRLIMDDESSEQLAVWVNRPTYGDYLEAAFEQIRRIVQDNVHVTAHLLRSLEKIGGNVSNDRAEAVRKEIDRITRQVDKASLDQDDREMLLSIARAALDATRAPVPV